MLKDSKIRITLGGNTLKLKDWRLDMILNLDINEESQGRLTLFLEKWYSLAVALEEEVALPSHGEKLFVAWEVVVREDAATCIVRLYQKLDQQSGSLELPAKSKEIKDYLLIEIHDLKLHFSADSLPIWQFGAGFVSNETLLDLLAIELIVE